MLRVIAVNTGTKYSQWYVNNLKHMIDTYSNLNYNKFEVITKDEYDGVFNKLQMFDMFRDGQNIYFALISILISDLYYDLLIILSLYYVLIFHI